MKLAVTLLSFAGLLVVPASAAPNILRLLPGLSGNTLSFTNVTGYSRDALYLYDNLFRLEFSPSTNDTKDDAKVNTKDKRLMGRGYKCEPVPAMLEHFMNGTIPHYDTLYEQVSEWRKKSDRFNCYPSFPKPPGLNFGFSLSSQKEMTKWLAKEIGKFINTFTLASVIFSLSLSYRSCD